VIVVEVGVKFMVAAPHKKSSKLGAKQLNIFKIDCKATQYFWIQSLI
jgi:hypothetical protein